MRAHRGRRGDTWSHRRLLIGVLWCTTFHGCQLNTAQGIAGLLFTYFSGTFHGLCPRVNVVSHVNCSAIGVAFIYNILKIL